MKCSLFSTFVLLLPFFAQILALTVPEPLAVRAFGGNGFGGNSFGKGKGSGRGAGAGAGAGTTSSNSTSSNSTAVASTSTTSSAAAAATGTNSTAAPAATGNNSTAAAGNTGDPQTSLTLDPNVIAKGFENNGQDVPTAGQVASLTSSNNYINFCLTVPNLPLTNGKQITTGSCNPAPMGVIASSANMPSSKFTNPKNGDTIPANKAFTITMAISNLQTGAFANAQENYYSAPQQVNAQGQIIGHSHVVVEQLTALDQTTPNDPTKFAFFKGLNAQAANGVLSADVTNGLPTGVYKLSSINSATNHQPVLVAIAQHGSLDDAVYFTVSAGGAAAGANNATNTAGAAAGANNATNAAGAAAGASNSTANASSVAATPAATGTGTATSGRKGGKTGKGGKFGRRSSL